MVGSVNNVGQDEILCIGTGWRRQAVLGPLFAERKSGARITARMSNPKRIQRRRAKGWKMPANAIYVGRPTVWGNPYVVGSELMNGEMLTAEKDVEL